MITLNIYDIIIIKVFHKPNKDSKTKIEPKHNLCEIAVKL